MESVPNQIVIMKLTTNKFVLNWCQRNGWKEPQLVEGSWWAIKPDSFVPVPIPAPEISSTLEVDPKRTERAQEAIRSLELTPKEEQEARDKWEKYREEILGGRFKRLKPRRRSKFCKDIGSYQSHGQDEKNNTNVVARNHRLPCCREFKGDWIPRVSIYWQL